MRKMLIVAAVAFCLALALAPDTATAAHRLGAGANYWKTIDNLDSTDVTNIDEDGLSWLASYQYAPAGIFKLEVDLEYYPSLDHEGNTFWSPEAFVLLGGTIYAGVGIGTYYSDGIFNKTPFYMLRAGLDLAILPFLFLDINANYRFDDWSSFSTSDLNTDTIRLGAALRFAL